MENITTLELLKLLSALNKPNNAPAPTPADKEEIPPSTPTTSGNGDGAAQKNTDLSSHREEGSAYADFLKAHDERVRRIKK